VTIKFLHCLTAGLLITLAMCGVANAQRQRPKGQTIYAAKLDPRKIVGYLGHSLGEIITIEGVTADETYTRKKADTGHLLLRVQAVNGKRLKREVVMYVSVFEAVSIKDRSPGIKFKYIGYETGEFSGTPEKAFEYVPRVATTGYSFTTSFMVLRDETETHNNSLQNREW
jgi:hypothetical protein